MFALGLAQGHGSGDGIGVLMRTGKALEWSARRVSCGARRACGEWWARGGRQPCSLGGSSRASGRMIAAFIDSCTRSFRPLVPAYAFADPVSATMGRKCFVRYRRGSVTVPIAWEPGLTAIVELFVPAGAGDMAIPRATRGTADYARRIPKLRRAAYIDPRDPRTLDAFLGQSMAQLSQLEWRFLAVPKTDGKSSA